MIDGLGGGIGAARLVLVVNTADDVWHHGLRDGSDIDTNLYWLAARADTARAGGCATRPSAAWRQ